MESAGVVSGKSVFSVLPASKHNSRLRESRVVPCKVRVLAESLGYCGGIRGLRGISRSEFVEDGHVRYYGDGGARCVEGGNRKGEEGKMEKKRTKLLEGLSRDLAVFIEMNFGVDHGKRISLGVLSSADRFCWFGLIRVGCWS